MDKTGVLKSVIYLTKFVLKKNLYNPNKPGPICSQFKHGFTFKRNEQTT